MAENSTGSAKLHAQNKRQRVPLIDYLALLGIVTLGAPTALLKICVKQPYCRMRGWTYDFDEPLFDEPLTTLPRRMLGRMRALPGNLRRSLGGLIKSLNHDGRSYMGFDDEEPTQKL